MSAVASYDSVPTAQGFTPGFAGAIAGGGVLLVVALGMIYALVRQHKKHKRLLADLEQRGISITQPNVARLSTPSLIKPRNVLRRSTYLPYGNASAWGSLTSREDVDHSVSATATTQPSEKSSKRRGSGRLSWPFSRIAATSRASGVGKGRFSHLSAIMESPRSLEKTPSPRQPAAMEHPTDTVPLRPSREDQPIDNAAPSRETLQSSTDPPEPSKDDSLTIQPTVRRVSNDETVAPVVSSGTRSVRSKSIPSAVPSDIFSIRKSRLPRPQMHTRSVSLTSQHAGLVPNGPVPPLPANVAAIVGKGISRISINRTPSKNSVSSLESGGSSLLLGKSSPLLLRTPSVQLKEGANRDWKSSVILGPRPLHDTLLPDMHQMNPTCKIEASRGSVTGNVARYSVDSLATNRFSLATTDASPQGDNNHLSVGNIRTAETVRFSRVSSSSSINKSATVQVLNTPRRHSRSKVSLFGSPKERRRHTILRDVSGNQAIPTRQLSQASSTQASSTRSSNGNPFQWDPSPLQSGKPSAMKGSPTSRKGHRRQNCVRISLNPTILGCSRSPSPSSLNGIQEESPDTGSVDGTLVPDGIKVSKVRSLPRPPSSNVFAPDVKLNPTTLRASLTPSSPTLSLARFDQDDTFSPDVAKYDDSPPSSPPARNPARLSTASSIFSIPPFPKPARNWNINHDDVTPTFAFQRPSSDFDEENRPPVTFDLLTQPISPSDLALTSKPDKVEQYGSESPIIPGLKLLNKQPSAANEVKTLSLTPERSVLPADDGLPPIVEVPSSVSPPSSHTSTQPHAFLPVSPDRSPNHKDTPTPRHTSEHAPLTSTPPPTRPPPAPPISEDRPTTAPQGPRTEPPKDLRKAITQLRRMNSEAELCHRPDRRYLHLGREASPTLPALRPGADSRASLISQDGNDDSGTERRCGSREARNAASPNLARRESSVWEDGEKFWEVEREAEKKERIPLAEIEIPEMQRGVMVEVEEQVQPARRSGNALRSPKRRSDLRRSAILAAAAATPTVTVQGPSGQGTPGSLYDQDGFLRA